VLSYAHAAVMDLVVISSAWNWWDRRGGKGVPDTTHLIVALNGLAALAGSSYLGGKMVYEHGVGVDVVEDQTQVKKTQ